MFNFDLSAWILKAIPSGFWPGLIAGAVLASVTFAVVSFLLALLKRHWKTVLIVCAIVTAISAAMLAL